jgi:4-hydroxybenzoate polyprenyltransferase
MNRVQRATKKMNRTAQRIEGFNGRPYIFPFVLLGLLLIIAGMGITAVNAIGHALNDEPLTFGPEGAFALAVLLLFGLFSLVTNLLEYVAKSLERFSNWLGTLDGEPQK